MLIINVSINKSIAIKFFLVIGTDSFFNDYRSIIQSKIEVNSAIKL